MRQKGGAAPSGAQARLMRGIAAHRMEAPDHVQSHYSRREDFPSEGRAERIGPDQLEETDCLFR